MIALRNHYSKMEFNPLSAALTDPNLSSHVLTRPDSHLFPLNSLSRKTLHCSFTHHFLSPTCSYIYASPFSLWSSSKWRSHVLFTSAFHAERLGMFLRLNNKFKNHHCINTELRNLFDKDHGKFMTKRLLNGMNNFHRDKSKTGIFFLSYSKQ